MDRHEQERQQSIADALCGQWRLFEHIALGRFVDGVGFHATIYLNETIIRGAAEQQGSNASPASLEAAEARRAKAISDCVKQFNATRTPTESIRDYIVTVNSSQRVTGVVLRPGRRALPDRGNNTNRC